MILGHIAIKEFLEATNGEVRGRIFTDGKDRWYAEDYSWAENDDGTVRISKRNGSGDQITMCPEVTLDESLVGFFGLYSGDGSKGTENISIPGKLNISISFSQKESNLVKFAALQFRRMFQNNIHFNFALGEDSAWFMGGVGLELLKDYYGGSVPPLKTLTEVRSELSKADLRYLGESRSVLGTNEEHLAFYYQHYNAMNSILRRIKEESIRNSQIPLTDSDEISVSVRRPFKKGTRVPGGSSRSDELHVGGLNGFGAFFLKMLHEMESSLLENTQESPQGLIKWCDTPSRVGEDINIRDFFAENAFGCINGARPLLEEDGIYFKGKWPRSTAVRLKRHLKIDPLWCYTSGLYFAEGSTSKELIFSLYSKSVSGLSFSFTSSEGASIELLLRALQKLFKEEDCLGYWKVKVGAQYFPELVAIGLKNGVPMLRGGPKGQGKLKTLEISLAIKKWALKLVPCLIAYQNKYTHTEPTGSGIARVDFSASSALCRWYFPIITFTLYKDLINSPVEAFYV